MNVRKYQSLQQGITASDSPLTVFQREIFFPTDSAYFDAIDGEELKHRFPSAGHYIEFDPLPFLRYLPDLEAEIFWLAFKREKYQKDIAVMLGLSVITVSYRYRRAIQKIGYLMVIEALGVKAILADVPFLTDKERAVLYDLFYYVNQDMVGKLHRNDDGQPLRQSTVKWFFIKFQTKVRRAELLDPERWLKPLVLIQFLERHFTIRVRTMSEEDHEPKTTDSPPMTVESFDGMVVKADVPDAYLMPFEEARSVSQLLADAV